MGKFLKQNVTLERHIQILNHLKNVGVREKLTGNNI